MPDLKLSKTKEAIKLLPCPFCGSSPQVFDDSLHPEGARVYVRCGVKSCIGSSEAYWNVLDWNKRPSEKKLKAVIDILIKGIAISLDENFTHKMRTRRLQEALDDARRDLGIATPKK